MVKTLPRAAVELASKKAGAGWRFPLASEAGSRVDNEDDLCLITDEQTND